MTVGAPPSGYQHRGADRHRDGRAADRDRHARADRELGARNGDRDRRPHRDAHRANGDGHRRPHRNIGAANGDGDCRTDRDEHGRSDGLRLERPAAATDTATSVPTSPATPPPAIESFVRQTILRVLSTIGDRLCARFGEASLRAGSSRTFPPVYGGHGAR